MNESGRKGEERERRIVKCVAIAGASGVVGSRALEHLLAREEVGHVIALGRRPLAIDHDKLISKVVDLQHVDTMESALPEKVDVAISALGTTMKKAGSKEAFRAVDRDAVVAFGEAVKRKGARRFLLVSSIGAGPRAKNFYLRTKGEAEEAVEAIGFEQLTIVRPSLIDAEGARTEFRLGERVGLLIARPLFALLGKTRRHAPIRADSIGKALVRLAFDDSPARLRIVESERLHELGR